MRLLYFPLAFFFFCSIPGSVFKFTDNQGNNFKNPHLSDILSQKTEIAPTQEGEYILHKDRIDSEIELLKEKYPELKNDVISYKFLFAPKQGFKQFFESDGSPFIIIKIYTKNIKPGDMITISDVKYKDDNDSTNVWKKFDTKLLFVFE